MRFKKKGRPDLFIFFVTLLLLAIGVIMVFSASYYDTLEDDPYFYLRKQITWAGLGLVAMLVMTKIDYFRLKPYINLAFGVGIILLILVLFRPGQGLPPLDRPGLHQCPAIGNHETLHRLFCGEKTKPAAHRH